MVLCNISYIVTTSAHKYFEISIRDRASQNYEKALSLAL